MLKTSLALCQIYNRNADGKGTDRFSQAFSKRVRLFSKDPECAQQSQTQHEGPLRQAEVFAETARAIEGHSYGVGHAASYGGEISAIVAVSASIAFAWAASLFILYPRS
jgi:hypothetical protein